MIKEFRNNQPKLGRNVYISENAAVIGDVALGDEVNIWFSSVLRGDMHYIRVGSQSNIQDNGSIIAIGFDISGDPLSVGEGAILEISCTSNYVLDPQVVNLILQDVYIGNILGEQIPTFSNSGLITVVPESSVLGDVNNDGEVNVADIVSIIQFILEYSDLTIAQQELADFNQDGAINVADIVQIVQYIFN